MMQMVVREAGGSCRWCNSHGSLDSGWPHLQTKPFGHCTWVYPLEVIGIGRLGLLPANAYLPTKVSWKQEAKRLELMKEVPFLS